MGSFANSLHVKSADADRVAATITEVLGAQGWRATEKGPDERSRFGSPSGVRGLHVSVAVRDWVSILDSDLMNVQGLASSLAERLAAHTLFCLVNDSDSWSYVLVAPGGAVSQFDSEDEADGEDDLSESEMAELGDKLAALQGMMTDGSLQQRMQELSRQMLAEAPPEIRELEARMRGGKVTAAEMQQYQKWAMEQMPKYMAQLDPVLGGLMSGRAAGPKKKPQRKRSKAQKAAEKSRLDQLRPLLAAGTTDEQVQGVFDKQAVFAEEVLAEFLPLLGISGFYANLSYQYLREAGSEALAAHDIRFVHDLRYAPSER
jgi:hypothetical protein